MSLWLYIQRQLLVQRLGSPLFQIPQRRTPWWSKIMNPIRYIRASFAHANISREAMTMAFSIFDHLGFRRRPVKIFSLIVHIYFSWVSAFVGIFFALRPTDIQQVCSHTETAIFYIEIRLEWIQIRSLGSRLNEDTVPSYLEIRAMSVNSRRAEKACNPGSRLNFFYLTRASIAVSLKLLDFRCGTSYDYQDNCRPRTVGRFRLLFIPSIPDQGAHRKICSPCFPPRSKGGTRYYNSNLWEMVFYFRENIYAV